MMHEKDVKRERGEKERWEGMGIEKKRGGDGDRGEIAKEGEGERGRERESD